MTIETEIASLTQATTDLISAVNVKKAALDSAEANAVSALDDFESQYIGARASAPSTDADGDALITGALYYNTSNTTMYVYTGSAWDALVDNLVVDPNAAITSNIATNGNDIKFGDNDKATFGASDDLQIYHDGGTNRVIGSVDVTGTISADGLTVDGDAEISGTASRLYFTETDTTDKNTRLVSSGGDFFIQTSSDDKGTNTPRFSIDHATGNVSFYEDTGTTAKMVWSSSAESLGIGTTSPSYPLHISTTLGYPLLIERTNSNDAGIRFKDSNTTDAESVKIGAVGNDFRVIMQSTEAMRIDSSGNVGIGTDSPSSQLHVNQADGSPATITLSNTNNTAKLTADDGVFTFNANVYTFENEAGTERARLESSGNLLVGTTNNVPWINTGGDTGHALREDGRAGFSYYNTTAGANATVNINRTGSDGDIARFFKDGSTVGSIGTINGDLEIHSNASGHTGLRFANGYISPVDNSGALSDGIADLGTSGYRWKDLYLSGGVYLGGTGSVNKLDDYETGAWTPVAAGYSGTMTITSAVYRKIGRDITLYMNVTFDGTSDGSVATITGLPFSIGDSVNSGSGGYATFCTNGLASSAAAVSSSGFRIKNKDGGNVSYTTLGTSNLTMVFKYYV